MKRKRITNKSADVDTQLVLAFRELVSIVRVERKQPTSAGPTPQPIPMRARA